MAIYSIWGVANRIKIEPLIQTDTVGKSIFEGVYKKADRLFFKIIKEMQDMSDKEEHMWWDDQTANVISFLGGRGRGKTSAMLSFYSYLRELKGHKKETWGELQRLKDKKVKFVEIPCIDAAALAQNEFIIEVILAKMWDGFDAVIKKDSYSSTDSHLEYLIKNVRTEFVNVQKSYTILRDKEMNKEKAEEISAASALHELAASMNFKEEFKQLVQNYIKVLNYDQYSRRMEEEKGYLILAIDDIDMAGEQAQSILEQIRRFLSIPQVVVLLTADIERLKDVCEAFYQRVYPKGKNLHKFVSEYLEKILPTNLRIYMPELSENQKEISIDKDENGNNRLQLKSACEKEMIIEIMAAKFGIYFDGLRRNRHFLQNDSLRSLVNYFNSIADMEGEGDIAWLKNDLQERIVERLENDRHKEFIRNLLARDYEDVNNFVLSYLRSNWEEVEFSINTADKSLGQVLYACGLLEDEDVENINFVNCILFVYTIMLRQADNELRGRIIGNSIWGGWEYGVLTPSVLNTDLISGFANRAELELKITDDVNHYIRDGLRMKALEALLDINKHVIEGWLYAMLFVNIKQPENISFKASRSPKSSAIGQEDFWVLQPQINASRSYFGFLDRSLDSYRDTLKQLLREGIKEIHSAICKGSGSTLSESETDKIDELIQKHMTFVMKEDFNNQNGCVDFVKSIESVYSIGRKIGREKMTNTGETEKLYEKMRSLCQLIRDELRKRDAYYKKIGRETNFGDNFTKQLHVKIFLEPDGLLAYDVKPVFIDCFTKLFRGVISVDKD